MPLSATALEPLLRLALVPGVGPQRLLSLTRQFGSADRALGASVRELEVLPGMNPAVARAIHQGAGGAGDVRVARATAAMRRLDALAITPDDPAYPDGFRVLAEPPFLLFAAGRVDLLEWPAVAVVGTRTPTGYGRGAATTLSEGLGREGYAVVSGMARGIDTAAHTAALDVGGATIGVLGHGIDQVYPSENRRLFSRVREQGLLLTEFPPGERPKAGNFPRRNRLISALSQAVLIVEMGLRSGAQHTVTYALEQGKEVMAVPGPIGVTNSAGTNQLIKDGARVVTSLDDILEELRGVGAAPAQPRPGSGRSAPESRDAPTLRLLSADEERVLGALGTEVRHVDQLGVALALDVRAVLATLLELELKGAIEAMPGKLYRRV